MKSTWRTTQLGDIVKGFAQYRPYLLLVAAVVLVVTSLPNAGSDRTDVGATGPNATKSLGGGSEQTDIASGSDLGAGDTTSSTLGSASQATGPRSTSTGGRAPLNVSADALDAPGCDRSTGRIRVPSLSAPPCVAPFKGDNGGNTSQGVTATEITIAIYMPQSDPQTDAALKAAGVGDEPEQIRQQYLDWINYFESHFETYGRKIKPVFVDATGPADDDTAGRADAIDIATRVKAFAVWTLAQPFAFVEELAARGVMVFSYVSDRAAEHTRLAPYYWSPGQMGITHLYLQTAEYVGKRLANKPAKHAGAALASMPRKLGLLFIDDASGGSQKDAAFFEAELAKYGASLTKKQSFVFDYGTLQTQATTIMAAFKDAGVTSIILVADFLSPTVLTPAATNQAYFPEWIVTGSLFTDLNFYGRLYDQAQWAHAFGLSAFGVRFPKNLGAGDFLYHWHFNKAPPAPSSYAVLYIEQSLLFYGIHMAGPNLNPQTFRQGVFNLPPVGGSFTGGILGPGISFGKNGGWPFDDYVAFDDVSEIWWKSDQPGKDELGNDGRGMYMFADGGKRYAFKGHPTAPSKAFQPAGAISFLNEQPENERPPMYEHKHFK